MDDGLSEADKKIVENMAKAMANSIEKRVVKVLKTLSICPTCNGSGEGYADGTRCCACKGLGELVGTNTQDDDDEDDSDD